MVAKYKEPDCMMVSLRDVRIASKLGHVVFLRANEPGLVPGCLVDQASSLGCVPSDSAVFETHKRKLEERAAAEKLFNDSILAAIDGLVKRNDIEDFTPTGYPKIAALEREVGCDKGAISDTLRDHLFAEWRARNRDSIVSRELTSEKTGNGKGK